ncbi:MAG: invasion associated locus B family protein [Pseudomonadota bacterium]|nr:invasion associated locus B family protein [Pseudomonadota bacterium]
MAMFATMTQFPKILAVLLVGVAVTSAVAQPAPQKIGDFRDWSAWLYRDGDTKVCFITSEPKRSQPDNVRRGDIRFNVAHRPTEGVEGEVSMIVGYPFEANSAATARIDGTTVTLRTDGERAWTSVPADDQKLVNGMKAGLEMVVRGKSSRGTETTDTYSLLGFSAAFGAINKACAK